MNPADPNQSSFNSSDPIDQPQASSQPAPLSAQNGFSPPTTMPPAEDESMTTSSIPISAPTMGYPGETQSPPTPSSNGNKNKVLAVFTVILMLFGLGTGVFLVGRQQFTQPYAWDCTYYNFILDSDGTVRATNSSSRNEPSQEARVYINGTLVQTFNVPAIAAGEGATLGVVSVPRDESYTWAIEGSKDCQNSGSQGATSGKLVAQCNSVSAYSEDWVLLTPTELSQLSVGDTVYFTIDGSANRGFFQKARFSINGAPAVEVTTRRPGGNDFYIEYTIPAGIKDFSVTAEMMHSEAGWL